MYLHIINILYEKYEKQIEYTPPEPKDCWSFHHFKTGVSVSDRCGAMLPAQPESLYIVPPKAHFRIIGSEDGYVNTIIWFNADSKLMDKFDLPLFSPIELPDIEYISKLLMDLYSFVHYTKVTCKLNMTIIQLIFNRLREFDSYAFDEVYGSIAVIYKCMLYLNLLFFIQYCYICNESEKG